jgi:hypothetical protein
MSAMNRRNALKTLGSVAVGSALTGRGSAAPGLGPAPAAHRPLDRPLTAVVLGAGNRGNVYAGYAALHPDELKIVGVAEPVAHKNERFAKKYGIPDEHRFVTWEHALDVAKFADLVFITMPDRLHYLPAMKAIETGYDVLLEKAIAQSWRECRNILLQTRKYGKITAVCHVLRYTPYFRKMKELCDGGTLGDLAYPHVPLLRPGAVAQFHRIDAHAPVQVLPRPGYPALDRRPALPPGAVLRLADHVRPRPGAPRQHPTLHGRLRRRRGLPLLRPQDLPGRPELAGPSISRPDPKRKSCRPSRPDNMAAASTAATTTSSTTRSSTWNSRAASRPRLIWRL